MKRFCAMPALQAIITARGGLTSSLSLRIENPPYMRLVIERLPDLGPRDLPQLSVAHYSEQNGDAIRDPEVILEVQTIVTGNFSQWAFFPVNFSQDLPPFNQRLAWKDDEGRAWERQRWITDCLMFCRTWDRNLRAQRFIQAAKEKVSA